MKKLFIILNLGALLVASAAAQPTTWQSRGVGGGGALFSPSLNPANPDEFYVACDMSEVFHTTDYGRSYDLLPFQQLQGGHDAKVCFTSTPGLRYCVSYAHDAAVPVKSTDGGLTWSPLPGNPDPTEGVYSLFVDYQNPSRLLLSHYGGIYFSANGGTSFSLVHAAANAGAGVTVGGAFFDGTNIYLGTNDGLLVSTNGGTSFGVSTAAGLPAGERIWSFAGAKAGGVTRFFCLTGNAADVYVGKLGFEYYNFAQGIYALDYGPGAAWTRRTSGITAGTDFPMFVGMAENDINTAYLAGGSVSTYPIVLKTTNGGSNWAQAFRAAGNQNVATGWCGQGGDRGWGYAECPFGLAVARTDASRVAFSDFGFVHNTRDGGTSWQQAYVALADQHPAGAATPAKQTYRSVGLENTTCWQVLWTSATNLFAGFSDIQGVRSADGGQKWSFDYTGHTANSLYRLARHPGTGTLFAATSNVHDMYQSTRLQDNLLDADDAQGKLIYSLDEGRTWQPLHVFNHPVFWVALDPSNPNRAYASVIHYAGGGGAGGVYVCNDLQNLAAATWTKLPDPPRTEKHPACLEVLRDGTLVATYSGRRTAAGAFTASSGVFVYRPAAGSWADVSDPGMRYWTKDVVIDPADASQNTWYAGVFSGWGGPPNGLGGLYRTTNRGQTWTRISALDRVTSCAFNPQNANELYVTTETDGLWRTANLSAAVPAFAPVASYPFRQPERVFFNPYNPREAWVTSFGNGLRVGTLPAVPTATQGRAATGQLAVFPNPAHRSVSFRLAPGAGTPTGAHLVNALGQEVWVERLASPAAEQTLALPNLPAGMYWLTVDASPGAFRQPLLVQ